ncbi:MAG TPA: ATP-binding protein [Vicinamibacterales bacterium]|jgi:PAS domain S-box-containing protein|nr:ATP-binding protein [Vicinamibacterales bacterium]
MVLTSPRSRGEEQRRDPVDDLAAASSRFRMLVNIGHDMVYRVHTFPAHTVDFISGAAKDITGHTPEEFYADPTLVITGVHPDDRGLVEEALRSTSDLRPDVLLRWVHPDGKVVWAEHRRVPIHDASGRIVGLEGIARDVTERIETQRRLKDSEEKMRKLAARVQAAREDERTALARELHDELGQTLTAVKLELARAAAVLAEEHATPRSVDRLQSLVGLIEIGIETVKRLSTQLRPPALDHLGLASAVRWEAMAFRARTGIRCHVEASEEPSAITKEQQTVLFRIFQEALTNVVRHARASAVHVKLTERPRTFELRIRDNGAGITDAEIRSGRSIGLLGMRERATLVGGSFEIAGRRGKGTSIVVSVPRTTGARVAPKKPAGRHRR